jgi:hypothetical protein
MSSCGESPTPRAEKTRRQEGNQRGQVVKFYYLRFRVSTPLHRRRDVKNTAYHQESGAIYWTRHQSTTFVNCAIDWGEFAAVVASGAGGELTDAGAEGVCWWLRMGCRWRAE